MPLGLRNDVAPLKILDPRMNCIRARLEPCRKRPFNDRGFSPCVSKPTAAKAVGASRVPARLKPCPDTNQRRYGLHQGAKAIANSHPSLWPRSVCPTLLKSSAALLIATLLPLAGCRNQEARVHPQQNDAPPLASSIRMADARLESQLTSGFYGVEQSAWRWTARQFSVLLRPPVGSGKKGATLELRFTVPPVVITKLNTVTLSATAGSKALPPETYTQPGDYAYVRDIAPNLLGDEVLRVDFSLDKAMPPSGEDLRELGVIVLSVGLNPK